MDNFCPLPECRQVLVRHSTGEFDSWICPRGHGLAATLSELWGHFQDDEVKALWAAAKIAPQSDRLSPTLGLPMVTVTITIDSDEVEGNVGPDAQTVVLDVSPDEEFIWFDAGEAEKFAGDLPNPEPSAEDLAKIQSIADNFANSWVSEEHTDLHKGFVGWFRKRGDKLSGS